MRFKGAACIKVCQPKGCRGPCGALPRGSESRRRETRPAVDAILADDVRRAAWRERWHARLAALGVEYAAGPARQSTSSRRRIVRSIVRERTRHASLRRSSIRRDRTKQFTARCEDYLHG